MSEVDDIKEKLSLVEFIQSRVPLKKMGRNFKGLCPFHNEKSPSFVVSADRNIWHCFGCGRGGSIFDFVMEYDHVDFLEALETLADQAGVTLSRRPVATPETKLKDNIYEVNRAAAEYYHYLLMKHKIGEKARQYVKNRGISDKSVETFGIGYSANGWEGLWKYLRKKGFDDQLIETAGLILRSKRSDSLYYDRFRGRVMFPLRDHRGNIAGFAGRLLDPDAKEAKYINTSETPVYNKSNMLFGIDVTKRAIQDAGEAVVMEGELDVISSFQVGIGNAVAIKGSALTEGHVRLLKRFAGKLVLALDSDVAGDEAARRGIEIADRAGLELRVAHLVGGKDPDDLARTDPVGLKQSIQNAQGVYDYMFSSVLSRYDGASAYGKKNISDELLPVIAKIENPIVQGHYVKKLAAALGISEDAVVSGLRSAQKQVLVSRNQIVRPKDEATQGVKRTRREKLEVFLLALTVQGKTKELIEEMQETVSLETFTYPPVGQILTALVAFLEKEPVFFIKDFAASLPPELVPILDEAYLVDIAHILEDDNTFMKEWLKAIKEFRQDTLKARIKEVSGKIGASDDTAEIATLQQTLKSLTQDLAVLARQL